MTYDYDGNFPQASPCTGLTAPSSQYSTGRLSAVVFAGGIADAYKDSYCYQYAYSQPGRVATQQMMVAAPNTYYNSVNFTASYRWDDEGRMTSLQYPTVTATGSFGNMLAVMPIAAMQYDVNSRLTGMTMDDQNGQGPQPFASASYYATGQLYTLQVEGWTETRTYNSLMQLINQSVPYTLNMTYNYSATLNNGRITSSVDGVTGENTTYTYDALNRLTNASNSLWSEAYTYDGFGNLTAKAGSGGSPNPAPTVSMTYNSKNQLTNLYYDANGNQNAYYSPSGGNTYSVENRLTLEVLQNSSPYPANIYAYDPWGKRVMSGYNPNYNSPQPTYNYTFYGITGQKLAMVTCNGSNYPSYPTCAIVGQNVYFGKKLITAGGVNVVTDRLGSVRANGQGESAAYYPYGEERTSAVDGREKFGTYFRDAIGQDYADQRYYGSGTGSFWSVDPGPANLANPATWNRYAYANGDPVNLYDPSGTMANCPPGTSPAGTGFNMYCAGSIDFTQLCLGMLGGNWYQWQFTNPDAAGYASAQLACQNNQAPPVTIGGPYDDGSGGSDTQQPCPPVPTLPGGNGAKEIQRNIKRAENYMMSVASTDFEGAGGAALPALMGYLAAQFAPRGSWDYKSRQPKGGNPYAQAMEFGNFNFGAVLAGLGFGITFTQSAAGIAQIGICLSGGSCGSGIPFFKFPYGDQAGDQAEIQAGYNYEQAVLAGCVH